VRAAAGNRSRGWLIVGTRVIPVALGRGGIRANKREGDGATPSGTFRLLRLWYRADRIPRPRTRLPVRRISPQDTWCEDPKDRRYNRPVRLSGSDHGDRLWRDDGVYDLVVEINHNVSPTIRGRGSAVFIHVSKPEFTFTAGCVALTRRNLENVLRRMDKYSRINIR
jgi:L,D-peptidoglycan transpeptidase YkuD (ErfK/YbiS/YcfS/YnhG family)